MAKRKRSPVSMATIRSNAYRACKLRLDGQIQRAMFFEDKNDALVSKAERLGKGDEAYLAENEGVDKCLSSRKW